MTDELVALAPQGEMGRIRRDRRGRLSLTYAEPWRSALDAYPLSVAMPLAAAAHGDGPVTAFLWGLLPDNARVLDRWGARFQVSARNPFALLAHVGEDCAGAIQFVRPERLEAWAGAGHEPVVWLDDEDIAERLRLLKADQAAWRTPNDVGQFSLAGAQPKTALLLENGRFGVPAGRTPTTHILKPPSGELDGHAENEHFCLGLARRLGLPAARSTVTDFAGEKAIVVERYDRRRVDGRLHRIHQEDICQALSVLPTAKYQNEGGPGPRQIVELLRASSSRAGEDIDTFMDALALGWIIAGTDAHAKNYALLIGARGRVRLAPLYDIASALPYDAMDFQRLRLAMKVGRHYRLRDIRLRDWDYLARDAQVNPQSVRERLANLATRTRDAAAEVRDACRARGLRHAIIDRLHERITARSLQCLRVTEPG